MPDTNLLDFQNSWREGVAAPLRFAGAGIATAPPEDYPPSLVRRIEDDTPPGAVVRLGAYRTQYWFRLFTLLQEENPLLGHLLGWEEFNPLAAAFLRDRPPGRNLSRLGEGFPAWLRTREMDPVLVEAARVDASWNRCFLAPSLPTPTSADLARIEAGKVDLVLQPSVQILSLTRNWFPLRSALLAAEEVRAGPPAPEPVHLVLSRRDRSMFLDPVDAELARILDAVRRGSGWMAVLERSVARKPGLVRHIQEWFALGAHRSWWALAENSG